MDLKNRKEFIKLVADCRKLGIISVKSGDFELHLAREALFPESDYKRKKAHQPPQGSPETPLIESSYSDEDLLLWSSQGILESTQPEGAN